MLELKHAHPRASTHIHRIGCCYNGSIWWVVGMGVPTTLRTSAPRPYCHALLSKLVPRPISLGLGWCCRAGAAPLRLTTTPLTHCIPCVPRPHRPISPCPRPFDCFTCGSRNYSPHLFLRTCKLQLAELGSAVMVLPHPPPSFNIRALTRHALEPGACLGLGLGLQGLVAFAGI